jgi:PAS domain S-box-containing protein
MTGLPSTVKLAAELEELRARLTESEEALQAIRNGDVDAVVVNGACGEKVYTMSGAHRIYRQLIETMSEGAATLSSSGTILYANARLEKMLELPANQLLGAELRTYVPPPDQWAFDAILAQARLTPSRGEINMCSSDGRLLPTFLSASLLPGEGVETGFGLVLTDLTEQKVQERVAAAERLASLILKQAAEAIIMCDKQGQVVRVNEAAYRFCDDNPLAKPFSEAFPLRTGGSEPFHLAPVLRGETLRNDDASLERPGRRFDFILSAAPLVDAQKIFGCVVTLTDTTAQKITETSLRESEQTMRSITGSAMDAVILMDNDGKLAFWNKAAERILGYTESEAIGKELHAFLTPARYRDAFHKGFAQFQTTGQGAVIDATLELEATRKDGVEVPIELSVSSVILNGKWNAVGIMRDISERKLHARALARIDRALKTLSACDSAVVHAVSEDELLEKMCRTAVEVGGYQMAWVGFAEQDDAKTVRPVAWAGDGADFIRRANITWADTERGRGAAGCCVRTGTPQVVRNIATDPLLVPWREDFLRRGYNSIVSLPLSGATGPFGVLAIYAKEPDAFDADELTLLSDMAADLSYGITALRTHVAQARGVVQLEESLEATVQALASTVEMRDPYTAGHQRRVASLVVAIARELGFSDDRMHGLGLAATVHDIGKIAVPAEILSKPGKLSSAEYELVKGHVEAGFGILKDIKFPWPIAETVRQHHERLDGSGYPRRLKGEQILTEAMILAVADVVEAMSSHRPYRVAPGLDNALEEIAKNRGTLFAADTVDACLKLFRERGFKFPIG